MKRMRMNLLILIGLALLVIPCIVQGAEAEIRFNAALRTPNVSVRIGNTPIGPYRLYRGGYLPIRMLQRYRIRERDQRIALRLSRYTGVPVRELIRLRRRGYTWIEIGRWLRLPPPVVSAAMNQKSWKRFLREERMYARHGANRRSRRGAIYFDDYYYDD